MAVKLQKAYLQVMNEIVSKLCKSYLFIWIAILWWIQRKFKIPDLGLLVPVSVACCDSSLYILYISRLVWKLVALAAISRRERAAEEKILWYFAAIRIETNSLMMVLMWLLCMSIFIPSPGDYVYAWNWVACCQHLAPETCSEQVNHYRDAVPPLVSSTHKSLGWWLAGETGVDCFAQFLPSDRWAHRTLRSFLHSFPSPVQWKCSRMMSYLVCLAFICHCASWNSRLCE